MPPRIDIYIEEPRKILASVDVDPAAPQNTVNHIGIKLMELVQMGRMRSQDREEHELHVSYDGRSLDQFAISLPGAFPDLEPLSEDLETTLLRVADNPNSGITDAMRQSILARQTEETVE